MDQIALDLEECPNGEGWMVTTQMGMTQPDGIIHFGTKAEAIQYACVMYCEMPSLFKIENQDILDSLEQHTHQGEQQ